MDVTLFALRSFAGWSSFVERCRSLGAQRMSLLLADSVRRVMHSNNGVFTGDSYFNFHSHSILARVFLRLWLDEGPGLPELGMDLPRSRGQSDYAAIAAAFAISSYSSGLR